jgi:hypothetical protein
MIRPAPALVLALAAALAGCGETVPIEQTGNGATGANAAAAEAEAQPPVRQAVPVRIGELGPNFDACTAAGTTRHVAEGGTLPVRAAPFESAEQTGAVARGARFFICTRTHDQKWFGIVHDEAGALSEPCGVSEPITRRRDYAGPCRSGWVSSAFVKLVSGIGEGAAPPPQALEGAAGPAPAL